MRESVLRSGTQAKAQRLSHERLDNKRPDALSSAREKAARRRPLGEWAIQDSNLGPLPYQRSALTD